ncbi:MAG: hypothetical protein ACRERU_03740, partial [Methylococcales bacterium]
VRNTSSVAKAIVRLFSIMLSMFLLATITGEVPYLLSLLFFKYGPAGYWVHKFDFLNVFSDYQGWTNMKLATCNTGFHRIARDFFSWRPYVFPRRSWCGILLNSQWGGLGKNIRHVREFLCC